LLDRIDILSDYLADGTLYAVADGDAIIGLALTAEGRAMLWPPLPATSA
jgi:hypothetical protein